jgi:hypothetical protein
VLSLSLQESLPAPSEPPSRTEAAAAHASVTGLLSEPQCRCAGRDSGSPGSASVPRRPRAAPERVTGPGAASSHGASDSDGLGLPGLGTQASLSTSDSVTRDSGWAASATVNVA